jgi:long-subunit acyl-CoA synthetase (AMP-forming)
LPIIEPFNVENNQLTSNGRLKRNEIWQAYQEDIETLYENTINQLAI